MGPKKPNFFFLASMITKMEIAEIMPNDPNQLSETYSTKRSLAGKSSPVIAPNTMKDSKIPRNYGLQKNTFIIKLIQNYF